MKFNAGVYQGTSIKCDTAAVLAKISDVLTEASEKELDIVQFPELFLCGYDISAEDTARCAVSAGGAELAAVGALALRHSIAVGVGYAERAADGALYNSVCVFDARGAPVLNYRKTHLWDPTLEGEKVVFHPGSELPVATLHLPRADATVTVGVLICFDCEFPEPARVLALRGASVVLVSTAVCDDATPRLMIPCRAAENHVAIIYSNLTGLHSRFPSSLVGSSELCGAAAGGGTCFCGQSAVIAPNGDELARASRTDSGLICAVIDSGLYEEHRRRNDYLAERRPELYKNIC